MSPMALQSASIVRAPMRLRWTLSLAKTISIGSGLDIGVEDLAVHRLVDHPRRGQAIATQSGNEGLGGRRAGHADRSGAISGLILKTISSGPPTLRRRAASSAHSCGRYELASRMLFAKVNSWFMGINTERARQAEGHFPLLYSGGAQLTARNATR